MSSQQVRSPAQAGTFYPKQKRALEEQIRHCFQHRLGPGRIPEANREARDKSLVALIVPHAGYDYSGPVAAHSYQRLSQADRPTTVVIVGPNHTGYGTGVSTVTIGEWMTPLGNVTVDSQMANDIVRFSGLVDVDETAHKFEHSIEVQLPFLQYLYDSNFRFVPVCMMLQDLETSLNVGETIAKSIGEKQCMMIASSDWTHYEPYDRARIKDMKAISAVLEMNESEFQNCIEENNVSACGYGPVTAIIKAAKELGARRAELLSYQNSGDVAGEKSAVVGYASIAFLK